MEFVVTVLANPEIAPFTDGFIDTMATLLKAQGAAVKKMNWLQEEIACDLLVDYHNQEILDAHVQDILRGQFYDAVVQPTAGRKKKLLIADMDSTMITIECIDELADFVDKKAEVAAITERAMNGELNFEAALTERVGLLKGLSESVLAQCYGERVRFTSGAKELVTMMRHRGAYTLLVSGGFSFFTSRVRDELGFDADYSNTLEVKDGVLTGKVIPPILGKEAKLKALINKCDELGISTDEALAVGDGANDLPMLLAAGLGVAFHAKPVVRAQTKARINHCDLSALLFIQGLKIPLAKSHV